MIYGRFPAGVALACTLMIAGCQSGDGGGGMASLFGGGDKPGAVPEGKIALSELTAYCPKVSLRAGTAFFNTYEKGGDGDKSRIVYQASITDVTRSCTRAAGQLTVNVAVAGKVVPGPVAKAGAVTMPIRIVVVRGADVLYSQLHQFPVQIASTGAATQFVFNDPAVTVAEPTEADLQVFAGYDEGPPKPRKSEAF